MSFLPFARASLQLHPVKLFLPSYTVTLAGALPPVCYFRDTRTGQFKQAILQDLHPCGGRVHWKALAESFQASLVELERGGNPGTDDASHLTQPLFMPDCTYDVIITGDCPCHKVYTTRESFYMSCISVHAYSLPCNNLKFLHLIQ